MKAMILAAGFGTRLWPLTIGRTKPAIPLLNRPLIAYTIDYLRRYGFEELIINLHHEPDSVRRQIGDGSDYGVKIAYSIEEPEILGTAGALDRVRDLLGREPFVVVNGKIVTEIDLGAAIETHRKRRALATLVLRSNSGFEQFREVHVADGRIAGFGAMTTGRAGLSEPPLMFTGIHILEPDIFDYIPRGVFCDSVRDVYPRAIAEGRMIAAHVAPGAWYELSTLERYLAISLEFSGGASGRDRRDSGAGVIMDEDCEIEIGARVERSVLWKRVCVKSGARLSECIVGDDVIIPPGAEFHRAAIVRMELAAQALNDPHQKAHPSEMIGENLVVHFG